MLKRIVTGAMAGLAVMAGAQQPIKDASVDEMVNQLAPPAQASTRSLRNLTPVKREINLVINFDFDSARLQASSKPLLQNLAEAMQSQRLETARFKVEGHTDSKGTARYNEVLSGKRATAVVEFLVSQGISAGRLESAGLGSSDPLNKEDPAAAENRRVRISVLP